MDVIQKKTINELENEIVMPVADIAYTIRSSKVFTGDVTPIPNVLIEYFDKMELKAFSVIFRHQRKHGSCIVRQRVMAEYLGCSEVLVHHTIGRLESMGIVVKRKMYNNKKRIEKVIDFKSVQALNNFLDGKKPGAAAALRKMMGDRNVNDIPKDVRKKMETIYSWHNDPAEDEEYTFAHKLSDNGI